MYAAFLVNQNGSHNKQYAVTVRKVGTHVEVCTGWGRIGRSYQEKMITGGAYGDFKNENNADAYARTIVRNKVSEGYTCVWSTDQALAWAPLAKDFDVPKWFNNEPPFDPSKTIGKGPKLTSGSPATATPAGKLAMLKAKMDAEDAGKEEDNGYRPKPRFGYRKVK
jgi:predicted DNA-binding WGR domain protein